MSPSAEAQRAARQEPAAQPRQAAVVGREGPVEGGPAAASSRRTARRATTGERARPVGRVAEAGPRRRPAAGAVPARWPPARHGGPRPGRGPAGLDGRPHVGHRPSWSCPQAHRDRRGAWGAWRSSRRRRSAAASFCGSCRCAFSRSTTSAVTSRGAPRRPSCRCARARRDSRRADARLGLSLARTTSTSDPTSWALSAARCSESV